MALFSRRKVPEEAGGPAVPPSTSTVAELRPARRRTVGQLLRETREGFGSDIPRVAAALRIRAAYLEAIEEGRYDRLPGPVYALGFVRAYAAHLGLDGDEAVRRFKMEAEGLEAQRDLSFPVPLTERSVPTFAWLLLGLLLAVCILGFHYYLSSSTEPRPERVSPVPAELAPPPAAPAPSASAPAAPAGSASAPLTSTAPAAPSVVVPPAASLPPSSPTAATSPSASTSPPAATPAPAVATAPPLPGPPATGTNGIVSEPLPPSAATPAPAASEPAASAPAAETPTPASPPSQTAAIPDLPANLPAGHEYGLANGDTRVVIRALGSAWIRVSDKDGKPVFTQTLLAGDTYHVPNEPGLTFKTGVAKNLAFFVDGRQAPRVSGLARSNLSLDPDRLIAGTAGD
jgi:cytoskeleton protein RodZ